MTRKNIFQLVDENYDIQSEIRKIYKLFDNEYYFVERTYQYYTLKQLLAEYLFYDWKYRATCISIDEYLTRANASISSAKDATEEQIVNFLEVMENFIKLYFDNGDELVANNNIKYYREFETVFCELINTLEKHMGLTTREYKDRIVVYPKNAPLDKVIDLLDDEDVQWELIRYVREDLTLTEKRKSLAYLATNLGIEEDKTETNEHIKALIKSAENILNNLHIRHNNKTGKWENQAAKELPKKDAIALCDMVYNEMLTIVLLREHKAYEPIYAAFREKQKAAKSERNTEKK